MSAKAGEGRRETTVTAEGRSWEESHEEARWLLTISVATGRWFFHSVAMPQGNYDLSLFYSLDSSGTPDGLHLKPRDQTPKVLKRKAIQLPG